MRWGKSVMEFSSNGVCGITRAIITNDSADAFISVLLSEITDSPKISYIRGFVITTNSVANS